jgi:rubredoxin-NAD+ reductase
MQYICDVCGWEYFAIHAFPGSGSAPLTQQENIAEDYEYPTKGQFSKA